MSCDSVRLAVRTQGVIMYDMAESIAANEAMLVPNLELAIPPEEVERSIADKVDRCWGAHVGVGEFADTDPYIQTLVRSLLDPDHVNEDFNDQWGSVMGTAQTVLTSRLWTAESIAQFAEYEQVAAGESIPTFSEEVTEKLRNTILLEVDVSATLFPNAREAYESFLASGERRGPEAARTLIIWSAGAERFQHSKLRHIGIAVPDTDTAGMSPLPELNPCFKPIPAQSVIAAQKLGVDAMGELAQRTAGQQIVVLEDRPKNILGLQRTFPDAIGVWVRQGEHADGAERRLEDFSANQAERSVELQQLRGRLNAGEELDGKTTKRLNQLEESDGLLRGIREQRIVVIDKIAQLNKTLQQLYASEKLDEGLPISLVADLDDTAIDNTMRRNMQHAMVLKATLDIMRGRHMLALAA